MDPEIAAMDAEHARLQAELRGMKRALIEARTKALENAVSPSHREYLMIELERARRIGPDLDMA